MKYAEIRFACNVRMGSRDGNFYVAGPLLEIERNGDTVTLTAVDAVVDVPWASVAYGLRAPEVKSAAPSAEDSPPRRQDRRSR